MSKSILLTAFDEANEKWNNQHKSVITYMSVEDEPGYIKQPYFNVTNDGDLAWEGFANSKEELQERFPNGIVTEWEPIPFIGVWMS